MSKGSEGWSVRSILVSRIFLVKRFVAIAAGLVAASGMASAAAANTVGTMAGDFSVDLSGAATYRIPIDLPPGVNGLKPDLALVYSSSGGSDLLGTGWSIVGMSAITRCPETVERDGAFVAPLLADADRFCVDGQRMINNSGGYYDTPGNVYRTEIDNFQRITSGVAGVSVGNCSKGVGPATFSSVDRSGLTRTYGDTADSTLVGTSQNIGTMVCTNPTRYIWPLTSITDLHGNFIKYTYYNTQSDPANSPATVYIKEIDYGYSGTTVAKVVFTYDGSTGGIPDTHMQFVAIVLTEAQPVVLSNIQVESASGTVLRTYTLSYSATSNLSHPNELKSVKECADSGTTCYPATTFSYQGSAFDFTATPTKLAGGGMQLRKILDLDGDGLMDYVYCVGTCTDDTGEIYVVYGNNITGSGTDTGIAMDEGNYRYNFQNAVVISAYGDGRQQLLIPLYPVTGGRVDWKLFGANSAGQGFMYLGDPGVNGAHLTATGYGNALGIDLTGTGRSDLVFSYNGTLWYYANSKNGFLNNNPVNTGIAVSGQPRMYPVNYDGSGMAEIYVAETGIVEAQVTPGGSNTDPTVTSLVLLQTGGSFDDNNLLALVFVDSNGDGLSSAVLSTQKGLWCYSPNTGYGWSFNPSNFTCIGGDTGAAGAAQAVDWYRDGSQEVVFPSGNTWSMLTANGLTPSGNSIYLNISGLGSSAPVLGDFNTTLFLDVDGDGEPDMVYTNSGSTYFTSNAAMPFLMSQVTNGLGINTDITYIPLAFAKYTNYVNSGGPTSAEAPQIIPFTGAMNVVHDFAADSGDFDTNGNPIQIYTYYKYGIGALDQWGRGFLGFSAVESLNYNSGLVTLNTMSHTYPFQGMVTESDTYWNSSINPSTTSPQGANVAAGWLTKCTINTQDHEPDCPVHNPTLEPATFTTGNMISKTVNTFDSIVPNVSVVFPFIKDSLVSSYVLSGSTTSYKTVDTYTPYGIVGSSANVGYDIMAKSVTVTSTGKTDVSIKKTAYTFGYESTCPGRASIVTETDSFGPISAPVQYPDKVGTRGYDGNCSLTSDVKTIVSPTDNTYQLSSEIDYTPDAYGNVVQTQVKGTNVPVRTINTTYDSTERFPATVTNSLGQQRTTIYDSFGRPTKVVDANGLVVTYSYKLGRLTGSAGPDPSAGVTIGYGSCTGTSCVSGAAYAVTKTDNDGRVTVTQYDPLQRPLRVVASGFNGASIYQDTAYDILGRTTAVSKPYFSNAQSTSCWTQSQFDTLDRLTSKTQAAAHKDPATSQIVCAGPTGASGDDVTTSFTYDDDDFTTTSVTGTGNNTGIGTESVTILYNILGKPANATDSINGVNQYSYDPWGDQTKVITPKGNTVSATYDSAGNRLTAQDPDMGAWSYTYDGIGDLITQTDSAGQMLTNTYDTLGRLVHRSNPDGTVDIWQYDIAYGKGLGQLAYKLAGSGVWEGYAYDAYSHPTDKITVVNGQEYWVTTTYDDWGRVSQLVYPDMNGVNVSNKPNGPTLLTVVVDPNDQSKFDLNWQDTDQAGQIYHLYRNGTNANAASAEIYSGPVIGWVDSTITVDDTYTWTLQACDGSGDCSAPATTQKVVVLPPTVPGMPQVPAQSTQTSTSWPISWAASSLGITGTPCPITYKLYQSTDGGSTYTQAGSTITQACGDNSAVITANASGGDGTYRYEVQACASGACSSFSAARSYTVLIQPSVPRQVQAPGSTVPTGGTGSVAITWIAPATNGGNVVYNVSIQTGTTKYGNLPIYSPLATTGNLYYNDPEGTGSYIYQVVACNGSNTTLCSAPVTTGTALMTIPPASPGAPVPPNPDNHLQSWLVTWPASNLYSGSGTQGTITYYLYQSFGNTTSWTYAGSATSNFAYSPINTQNGTYYYEVKACVVDVNTQVNACSPMGAVSGYTTVIAPPFPTNVSAGGASNLDGSFTVTWTEPNNGVQVSSYTGKLGEWDTETQRYLWVDGNCNSSGTTTSCTANPNTSGSLYVQITACETLGSVTACSSPSTPGGPVNVTIANPPTLSGGGNSPTGAGTLTWTSVTGVGHYALYASYQSASNNTWGAYSNIANPTGTSKAVSLTSAQSAAHYYVEACDSVSCTAASNTKTLTYTAPAAPSLSGTSNDPPFALSWSVSTGATTYQVFKDVYNGSWSGWGLYDTVNAPTHSDSVNCCARASEVDFYIVACNPMGCSAHSNEVDVTINLCGSSCTSNTWPSAKFDVEEAPALLAATNITGGAPPPTLQPIPIRAPSQEEAIAMVPAVPAVAVTVILPVVIAVHTVPVEDMKLLSPVQLMALPKPAAQPVDIGSRMVAVSPAVVEGRIQWPPRSIDPQLSMYPPLRRDPRVMAQYVARGGQVPYSLRQADCDVDTDDTDCSEPGLVNAVMVQYQYGAPGTPSAGYLTAIVKLNADGSQASQLWVADDMTAMGQVDQATYDAPTNGGPGTVQIDDYFDQSTGVLGVTQVTASGGSALQAGYDWDGYNNLKDRTLAQNGQTVLEEGFTYDGLNRLKTGSTTAGAYRQSTTFGYDAEGDFDASYGNGTFTNYHYANTSQTLANGTVCTAGHPHALSDVTVPGGALRSYCYDANGNLQLVAENGVPTHQVAWQWFNKPSIIQNLANSASESFVYDGDHDRVANTLTQAIGSDTTVYVDGLFESEYNSATQIQTYRNYVMAGSQRVVVDTYTGGQQADQLGIFIHDQVGSVIGEVTEDMGGANQQMAVYSYDAWGKGRPTDATNGQTPYVPLPAGQFMAGATGQDEGYGGHENLVALGLVEMEGRIYDPEVSRFLSADPNVQFPLSTQGYNRYTYVNDNPLSLNDPSGYFSEFDLVRPWQNNDFVHILDPAYTAKTWLLRQMNPQEFAVVNMIGSSFCWYFYAACTAAGTYEYARANGATASDALRAGVAAGVEAEAASYASDLGGLGVQTGGWAGAGYIAAGAAVEYTGAYASAAIDGGNGSLAGNRALVMYGLNIAADVSAGDRAVTDEPATSGGRFKAEGDGCPPTGQSCPGTEVHTGPKGMSFDDPRAAPYLKGCSWTDECGAMLQWLAQHSRGLQGLSVLHDQWFRTFNPTTLGGKLWLGVTIIPAALLTYGSTGAMAEYYIDRAPGRYH